MILSVNHSISSKSVFFVQSIKRWVNHKSQTPPRANRKTIDRKVEPSCLRIDLLKNATLALRFIRYVAIRDTLHARRRHWFAFDL